MEIAFENIRNQEFPATKKGAYINAAAHGLSPRCVIDPMKDFLEHALQDGLVEGMAQYKFQGPLREKMAKLIHAETGEVAIARNTGDALAAIANGIRFKQGDHVIANDIEFPSNVYAWMNLERKGVKTKLVKSRDGRVLVGDIERSIDENTRVVTISSVSMVNGFKAELEKIGRLCKERNIYFVVDAIQQLGALDLDVKKCHINMLASGCYKWLNVPDGVGFLFVDKNVLEELDVSKVGWWNVKNERALFEVPGATYDLTFKDDSRRFQDSHAGVPGILGLNGSLDLIFKIGIENIEKRILDLTDLLIEGVRDRGIKVVSPLEKEYRSGIVVIDPKNKKEAYDTLVKNNIRTSLRRNGIRVSPHFYNNEEEIEKMLRVLEDERFR